MDKEELTDYIEWLLSQLDEISSEDIDKVIVRLMLLSIKCILTNLKDTLNYLLNTILLTLESFLCYNSIN